MDYLFSAKHFSKINNCKTYPLHMPIEMPFSQIFAHGFVADCACVWGGEKLAGIEFAIVSRTYCFDSGLYKLPDGLKFIKLPEENMGKDDLGTAIATFITSDTPAATYFMKMCLELPAWLYAHVLPQEMCANNHCVSLIGEVLDWDMRVKINKF